MLEGDLEKPLGAVSYVEGFIELYQQALAMNISLDTIVLATGSAGTQAGLIAGAKILGLKTKIIGISVTVDKHTMTDYIEKILIQTLKIFNQKPDILPHDIIVLDDYLAEGYGILNSQVNGAIAFLAQKEGILLDPVYTGKAFSGLLDLLKNRYFNQGENVIFLHTGGTPALFPYKDQINEFLQIQ